MHYTSIEESKKLLELGLAKESADMAYLEHMDSGDTEPTFEGYAPMVLMDVPINEIACNTIPCWSLDALFELMPESIYSGTHFLRIFKVKDDDGIFYRTAYHIYNKSNSYCGGVDIDGETAVESVFNMMVFLLERGFIGKRGCMSREEYIEDFLMNGSDLVPYDDPEYSKKIMECAETYADEMINPNSITNTTIKQHDEILNDSMLDF